MIVQSNPNYRLFQNRNKNSENKFHNFRLIDFTYFKGKNKNVPNTAQNVFLN